MEKLLGSKEMSEEYLSFTEVTLPTKRSDEFSKKMAFAALREIIFKCTNEPDGLLPEGNQADNKPDQNKTEISLEEIF